MEEYIRAHIRLNTPREADTFVAEINCDGTSDHYAIEDFSGTNRINARSLLGVIYALTEFNDEMFLVNDTNNGKFPSSIDKYRV